MVAVVAAGALAGCASSAGGDSSSRTVSVVASTNVYGDVAAQIAGPLAGNRVTIKSLITDAHADPHSFEATVRDELAISKADLIIENGGGYDDFMDTLRHSAGASGTALNVVRLSGKRPVHGDLNEHVWYDVPTVAKLADRIRDVLAEKDPRDRATFVANAAAFRRTLAGLTAQEAAIERQHAGAAVAITEPLPLYLLHGCGLVNATPAEFSRAVEDGTDVPPRVLHQAVALFTRHRVRALVYNEQTDDPASGRAVAAARKAHVPVVGVTETLPPGTSYPVWLRGVLDELGAALARR